MTGRAWRHSTAWAVLLAFWTSLVACGGSQESAPPPTTVIVPATVPTTAPPPTLPAEAPEQLSEAQLRELVAPVALYPDVVLASLLPATTYPEQIQDAAQYVAAQEGQIQGVPEDHNWDGSIAGLLQFPDVLNWLDQNDPWTEQMGTAMTYQQGDVLDAVQDYRKLALDAGNLKSNEYHTVSTAPDQDILIAPAQPDTVYVPQYDTTAVTQPQQQTGINPWLAFGGGAVVGALGAWALYSIFDDDDDDHYHHGGKKSMKQYNNYYYYGGGKRPPSGAWRPRPVPYRPGRPRPGGVVRPQTVQPIYATKPAKRPGGAGQGGGGLRPPKTRPAPAPSAAPQPLPSAATMKTKQKLQKPAQERPAQTKQGPSKQPEPAAPKQQQNPKKKQQNQKKKKKKDGGQN